jgi:hypothetical protein
LVCLFTVVSSTTGGSLQVGDAKRAAANRKAL